MKTSGSKRLLALTALVLGVSLQLGVAQTPDPIAVVTTDQPGYQPGETVLLQIARGDGTACPFPGHEPWPVVADETGGFVTGGGWINSPLGAYLADPTRTGKATFGFVAKYLKGTNVPTGNTEFQFKAGDLNFKSTSYEWLVVAGARAQFKGVGTINGRGNYAFMLMAIDGQVNGGGGVDRFRIKIWDMASAVIVYDNQIGTGDDAGLGDATIIQGGSIVIHKP
jgi:hypothetical protein